jgi:hypothetical protein
MISFTSLSVFMNSFLLPLISCLVVASVASGAVVYSGVQNLNVPVNSDGLYLNVVSGITSGTQPGTFDTAPWFNPFFGGEDIAVGVLSQLVLTGGGNVVNLGAGTLIDSSSDFGAGGFGASAIIGPALANFQLTTPGLVGIAFKQTVGGPVHYGWIRLTINNVSPGGTIVDWAYENTPGAPMYAGAVPEPNRVLLLGLGFAGLIGRRRR